ncbi:hypothetical protein FKP32DRAFT_1092836 [Trametes sanguinea]|nr:hypothetical protein FKP32DRAFT_1092836 [Trametes sanguinea]
MSAPSTTPQQRARHVAELPRGNALTLIYCSWVGRFSDCAACTIRRSLALLSSFPFAIYPPIRVAMTRFHLNPFAERRSPQSATSDPIASQSTSRHSLLSDDEVHTSSKTHRFFARFRPASRHEESRKPVPTNVGAQPVEETKAEQSRASTTIVTGSQQSTSKRSWPKTIANGLTLALKVTKEAAAAFPPLQSVAGGLLAIAEAVQQLSANDDNILTLKNHIEQLNKVLSPAALPLVERWSAEFKDRLSEFER